MRLVYQSLLFCMLSLMLLSCTSPKMSQELEQGKVNFVAGDYKKAFHSLMPVAANGNPQAEYAVGYMYYYGYGVAQDNESGLFWMQKSADQNFEPAVKALNMIRQKSLKKPSYPKTAKVNKVNDEGYLDLTLNAVHAPINVPSQNEDEVMTRMLAEVNKLPTVAPKPAPAEKKEVAKIVPAKPKEKIAAANINLKKSTCYWNGKNSGNKKLLLTRVRYISDNKKIS